MSNIEIKPSSAGAADTAAVARSVATELLEQDQNTRDGFDVRSGGATQVDGGRLLSAAASRELLFYNARSGAIATARVDAGGSFTGLKEGGGLSKGWTDVNTVGRELLFYNAGSGAIATARVDAGGSFTGLKEGGGLSKGWTHVNPLDIDVATTG